MRNKECPLTFHPIVKRWMKKHDLESRNSNTPLGFMASPKISRFPKDFYFTFDDAQGDIDRLNSVYGTSFDKGFLDVRFSGFKKLNELVERFVQVRDASETFPELKRACKGLYVGGISVPKRNFLYVEHDNFAGESMETRFFKDSPPEIYHGYTFIPVDKKYLPGIF